MRNKKEAVVLFSGGQDSTTCLGWAKKTYETVVAVSFDYGQRHKAELSCAAEICKKLGVRHEIFDLHLLNQLAPNSRTRAEIAVDREKPENAPPNTFVDGRNMVFLTYTAIYAKQRGITDIITGVSESDYSGYPDCRDQFIKSLNVTLNLAMEYDFCLITPLMWKDKAETWALADSLGMLSLVETETLTCYNGIRGAGCGRCPACKLRSRGLKNYLDQKEGKGE